MRSGIAVWAAMLSIAPALPAQDTFPNVEYISGKGGLDSKIKGQLVVEATKISFLARDGAPVFTLPMESVTEVSNSVEENPGSTGRKLLLGVFANKKEEFVYITTETTEAAEGLVFKTKSKMSPGIVAKIRFQMKKTGTETEPPVATEAAVVPDTLPLVTQPADSQP